MYSKVKKIYYICVRLNTYVILKTKFISYTIIGSDDMFEPMLDSIIVGETIAEIRKKKSLSQDVLSGLAGIGRTHLSAIERGERKPTLETLYRLSVAFDMKMSEIVIEIENKL